MKVQDGDIRIGCTYLVKKSGKNLLIRLLSRNPLNGEFLVESLTSNEVGEPFWVKRLSYVAVITPSKDGGI